MKKIVALILTFPLSLWSISFDGNANGENLILPQMKNEVELPQVKMDKAVSLTKTTKEWTIMVYLNAKNDLERFGIADMNEMEKVGSSDNVNIVVQMGRIKGYDSSNGDWTGVRRYYITKDTNPTIINSQLIEDLGEVDMGSYKTLAEFGKWVKKNYPAKKYFLIIWNHGTGWEKGFNERITKGISYDDVTKNHINTPQLGMALKEIGKVDLIGFDACLMGMAEVVYEIKDYATYIIASEETEPGDGYSYDGFLSKLASNPTMGPFELAKAVVDAYYNFYKAKGEGTTQSIIRTAQLDDFLKHLNDFAYTLSKVGDKNLIRSSLSKTQSFAIPENKDLAHFASLIYTSTTDSTLKEKSKALYDFIKTKLVAYHKYTNGSYSFWGSTDYTNSNGIAIYFPSTKIADGYSELKFAYYSNWDEFLNWYIGSSSSKSIIEEETTSDWHSFLFGGK